MKGRATIALLHLAPVAGDLSGNRERIRIGVLQAADAGAEWVLTPELSTSGYAFAATLGLEWIAPAPDGWASEIALIAAERNISVFLATAERDRRNGLLYNSLFAFDGKNGLVGSHRKINTLKIGSEAWSSPGSEATVVDIGSFAKIGLLICADACSPRLGTEMKAKGARALISSANWAPGEWGPAGEWEQMSAATGLPMFVCNRTGDDPALSFSSSESVVVANGIRHLAFSSPEPQLLLVDWDFTADRITDWSSQALSS
jgi:predicted amidohydrolase